MNDDTPELLKIIASVTEHDPDTHDFISPTRLTAAILGSGWLTRVRAVAAREALTENAELIKPFEGPRIIFDPHYRERGEQS